MNREIECPEPGAYYHPLTGCRQDKHEECAGRIQPTSASDTRATVCRCCTNNHYEGGDEIRHTEWKINRNWLREGDPCKVKGVSTDCVFRALITNGVTVVEVYDRRNARVRQVAPERVTRIAKTRKGA